MTFTVSTLHDRHNQQLKLIISYFRSNKPRRQQYLPHLHHHHQRSILLSLILFFLNIAIHICIMLAHLSRVVLMVRSGEGLAKALEFYTAGLGLQAVRVTDEWADLRTTTPTSTTTNNPSEQQQQSLSICLRAVTSEAQVTTGYSPLLQFQVENMDDVIAKCVQLGGNLDGPIQYPAHGKIAALRSPDGHMIGIYEAASLD